MDVVSGEVRMVPLSQLEVLLSNRAQVKVCFVFRSLEFKLKQAFVDFTLNLKRIVAERAFRHVITGITGAE